MCIRDSRNAWKIPELKNRLLFTLAILVVYRLGCAIPVPFVSGSALTQMFANGDMLSYLNMMSGGEMCIRDSIIALRLSLVLPSFLVPGIPFHSLIILVTHHLCSA